MCAGFGTPPPPPLPPHVEACKCAVAISVLCTDLALTNLQDTAFLGKHTASGMALSSAVLKGAAVGYCAGLATTLLAVWASKLLFSTGQEQEAPRTQTEWRQVQRNAARRGGRAATAMQMEHHEQRGEGRPATRVGRVPGISTPTGSRHATRSSTVGVTGGQRHAGHPGGSQSGCAGPGQLTHQQQQPRKDLFWLVLERVLGIWLLAATVQGSGPAGGQHALLALFGVVEAGMMSVFITSAQMPQYPQIPHWQLHAAISAAFSAVFLAVAFAPERAAPPLLAAAAAIRSGGAGAADALAARAAALHRRMLSHRWGLLSCLALEKAGLLAFYSSWMLLTAVPQLMLCVASLLSGRQAPAPTVLEDLLRSLLHPTSWTGACTAGPPNRSL